MPGSLLIVHVHVRVEPGAEQAFRDGVARQRRGEPARAGRRALRPDRRPRRPDALRARRDLRGHRGRGRAQGDGALRRLARRRRRADGRAAPQRRSTSTSRPDDDGLVSTGVRFEFATATRIVFGPGLARRARRDRPPRSAGGRCSSAAATRRARSRRASGSPPPASTTVSFAVAGEPTVEDVRRGAALARGRGRRPGGRAAAAAARSTRARRSRRCVGNGGDPLDYLEVVGRGQPLARPAAPFVAIPTTAGTGSEVTRNAVLASPEHRVKASLRSPLMLARARDRRPRAVEPGCRRT